MTYGKPEDNPDWWPKKPKWAQFRNPSKSTKEECTKLIRRLLEGHGIDADSYYINYPREEDESESSSESSGEEEEEREDANDNLEDEEFGNMELTVTRPEVDKEVENIGPAADSIDRMEQQYSKYRENDANRNKRGKNVGRK